jgi:hypothetical protein
MIKRRNHTVGSLVIPTFECTILKSYTPKNMKRYLETDGTELGGDTFNSQMDDLGKLVILPEVRQGHLGSLVDKKLTHFVRE